MSDSTTVPSRQSVLLKAARHMSRAENLEELLDQILESSREVMDCEVCSILLPDGPQEDLIIRSTLDPINTQPVRVPKGKGIAGDVYLNRKVVNIEDAINDPRHFKPASDKSGLVTHAMLTIPLLEGDNCLGVMQAINPNHADFFEQGDIEIFETFGSLITVTLVRLESQKRAIRNAETRQQLSMAREIQASFLPAPEVSLGGVAVEAFYEPASEIGGDFYFWHKLDDGQLLLGIGDVCGKGLAAALDMARGTTLIASTAHLCTKLGLGRWVTELNHRLCDVMSAGRFIAINAMLIDPEKRRVHHLAAGLPPSKVFDGTDWLDVETPGNPPLGISCAINYKESREALGSGRHWLIFSDGILELHDPERGGDHFEDSAFATSLNRIAANGNEDLLKELISDWRAFATAGSYHDDSTIMAVSDRSDPPPADFEFSCKPETLTQARDFVEAWANYCGFDDEKTGLVVLGCDEIFSNICKYAYCDIKGGGPASCHVGIENDSLKIEIRHEGDGISNEDFEKLVAPPSQGDRIGGLGMHVISEVFDKINFNKDSERSTIQLVKSLKDPASAG